MKMNNIRAIRSEADYAAAIARIDDLMDAEGGTPEGEELDVLTDLVELYEAKHVPMGFPSPLGAIRFRMEQAGFHRVILSRSWAAVQKYPRCCRASAHSQCKWRARYMPISVSP